MFIIFQEITSWNRLGIDKGADSDSKLSLFVHECVELQLSLIRETTESQSDRSSTGDDLDEYLSVMRLQRGTLISNKT